MSAKAFGGAPQQGGVVVSSGGSPDQMDIIASATATSGSTVVVDRDAPAVVVCSNSAIPSSAAAAQQQEIHESQSDKLCWSTFVSMSGLLTSFVLIIIYANWESTMGAIRVNSFVYFMYCMAGGVLSGLPHTLLVPIDLIKCRVQCGEYANFGDGFQSIKVESRGSRLQLLTLLYRGWAPTFIGYSLQGSLKFGLYELFKHVFADLLFPAEFAKSWKVVVYLLASMAAELIADVSLAPWEAVKIKMQTTRHYPPFLRVVVPRMYATEGMNAFFKGLSPLWLRQVPYTMMKFASFEKIVEIIYFVAIPTAKAMTPKPVQLMVSVAAGLFAGALCALVSHPADTVVSKLNQRADVKGSIVQFVAALGCTELWKGLGVRIVMIGIMTALQWLIYDSFKVSVGLPTTGSASAAASASSVGHAAMQIASVGSK